LGERERSPRRVGPTRDGQYGPADVVERKGSKVQALAALGPGGLYPRAPVLLGGSQGGVTPVSQFRAALLASPGHPALALCYFGCPGRPEYLADVSLEYMSTSPVPPVFRRGAPVGGNRNPDTRGFDVVKRRWVVERSIGWIMMHRHPARDYETLTASSNAMIRIASVDNPTRRMRTRPPPPGEELTRASRAICLLQTPSKWFHARAGSC
jgi:hypothetical protein